MLNNATGGFKKIYIACGQTDLRRGIEGLANIIRFQFQLISDMIPGICPEPFVSVLQM